MKALRAALLGLLLMSCGEARDEFDLLRGALQPNAAGIHPRAAALASRRPIPPRLEVGFPSRNLSGVMLLETERNGVQTWLTADGAAITLDQGFLTSAKGFGAGLAGSDIRHSANMVLGDGQGQVERFHSFLNGNDEIELHAYVCQITTLGPETVLLGGDPIATEKRREQCFGVAESFTNTYWVQDSTRQIVQSSQWTGAFLGNLLIKVVPDDI